MSKFNVGDKVRIKGDLSKCEFGYTPYMDAYKGKEATVIKVYSEGEIKLDIDKHAWCWSENVLELIEEGKTMKMKRIDYLLNAKDPIKVLVEEFDLDLKCRGCHYYNGCDVCNANCDVAFIEYLKQDIEVNESDFKVADVESIGQVLQFIHDIPPQIKIDSDKIKEVNVDDENDPVNHPSHYTDTKIEVMDYIEDKGFNFALGNAVKYISRAGRKDKNKTIEDLEKAEWYLNREIERLKKIQGK